MTEPLYVTNLIQLELAKYHDKDPKDITQEELIECIRTNKVGNYTLVVNQKPKYVEIYLKDGDNNHYYDLTFIKRESEL